MKKRATLLLAVVFAAVLGGAYLLYNRLSGTVETQQLTVEEDPGQIQEELRPDDTAGVGEVAEAGESDGAEPMEAPDFTVYDGSGESVALSDYFGKPIVLNFWASWCGPCRNEMPDFNAAYEEQGEEIHFLMINATGGQETQETAAAYVEGEGFTFPVFYDLEYNAVQTYRTFAFPTTFFIDGKGNLIARAVGAIDAATLQQGIDLITD